MSALKESRDIPTRSEVKKEPALRWSRESHDSVRLKELYGRLWRSVCLIWIYGRLRTLMNWAGVWKMS